MKQCAFCGTPFKPKRRGLYCTNACKMAAYRARKAGGEAASVTEKLQSFEERIQLSRELEHQAMHQWGAGEDPTPKQIIKMMAATPTVLMFSWQQEINNYCQEVGIAPQDLIEVHKSWRARFSGVAKAIKEMPEVTVTTSNTLESENDPTTLSRTERLKQLKAKML